MVYPQISDKAILFAKIQRTFCFGWFISNEIVDQWWSKPPKWESSVFRYRLQEERFCSMNHMQLDTRFQGAGAILDWNVWLCMLPLTYICLYTVWDLWKSGARRKSEPLGTDWSHRKSKDLWGYVFGLKGPSMTVAASTCGFTGFDWSWSWLRDVDVLGRCETRWPFSHPWISQNFFARSVEHLTLGPFHWHRCNHWTAQVQLLRRSIQRVHHLCRRYMLHFVTWPAASVFFLGIAWGMEYLSSGYAQRNLLVLLSQGSTAGRGIRLKGTWFCHCKDLRICMVLWPAYC